MRRMLVAACAAGFATCPLGLLHAQGTPAPAWNDSATMALVGRGVERRAQQLADTGLRDYTARANGYLTFLGQIGEGFTEPPRILKADQLALEVYWRAPDLSKQRIIGQRDTLLLPTDISYHRDHLGIVQNNFPEIIRLGEGDEVRDVPHPLSPAGLAAYDFRIGDSLRISLPGRVLDVYEVKVRPRDDRQARVIGSVFLERSDAQVVRMAFSFTRAAFLDRQLEDLSIVLENGLVGARFWLPRRQEIEIRRAGTWLDYPARGIIRGRWEIGDYALNQGIPASRFVGPEIVSAPLAELQRYEWQGHVLDSLPPDVRATTDEDVARVQEEARALVREEALRRGRGTRLGARAISDLVRVNRVEGLAVGGSVTGRLGGGLGITARARFGTEDERVKGALRLAWQRASGAGLSVAAYDDHAEAGDAVERSGVVNSLAAQEFGSDYTDPFRVRGVTLEAATGERLGLRWRLAGTFERQEGAAVNAEPAFGRFEEVLALAGTEVVRGALRVERPTVLSFLGTELAFDAELRVSSFDAVEASSGVPVGPVVEDGSVVTRGALRLRLERPLGTRRLVAHTIAAIADGDGPIPGSELAMFGGPVSGPGYDYHELTGRGGVSQRLELQVPVPFPSVSLGRFGRTSAEARVVPFVHVVGLHGSEERPWRMDPATGVSAPVPRRVDGLYPSVGVGLLSFFDLVRVDVARGLRDGRWTFNVDVAREFWRVL